MPITYTGARRVGYRTGDSVGYSGYAGYGYRTPGYRIHTPYLLYVQHKPYWFNTAGRYSIAERYSPYEQRNIIQFTQNNEDIPDIEERDKDLIL